MPVDDVPASTPSVAMHQPFGRRGRPDHTSRTDDRNKRGDKKAFSHDGARLHGETLLAEAAIDAVSPSFGLALDVAGSPGRKGIGANHLLGFRYERHIRTPSSASHSVSSVNLLPPLHLCESLQPSPRMRAYCLPVLKWVDSKPCC